MHDAAMAKKNSSIRPVVLNFDTTPACDGQTGRETDGQTDRQTDTTTT